MILGAVAGVIAITSSVGALRVINDPVQFTLWSDGYNSVLLGEAPGGVVTCSPPSGPGSYYWLNYPSGGNRSGATSPSPFSDITVEQRLHLGNWLDMWTQWEHDQGISKAEEGFSQWLANLERDIALHCASLRHEQQTRLLTTFGFGLGGLMLVGIAAILTVRPRKE